MSEDSELEAMQKIAAALEPLDDAARQRALQWAASRFRGKPLVMQSLDAVAEAYEKEPYSVRSPYETFAELFDSAHPGVERDKALVAAYWAQVCEGAPSFPAQALNTELKNLGHGVGNITEALTQLKNERPALILQLKKSGTSKQARKTYKLTQEGIKRVQSMLNGETS